MALRHTDEMGEHNQHGEMERGGQRGKAKTPTELLTCRVGSNRSMDLRIFEGKLMDSST